MSRRLLLLACIILVLGLTATAQNELKAHYKLDETSGTVAADASSNGYDGTVSGTANWVEGTLGGALEFLGTDSVVLPASLMGMTSDMGSVAFWMNADVPTAIFTMFWAGDNTTGSGFGPENEMHIHLENAGDSWSGGELTFFAITTASDQFIFLYSDPAKGGAAERANPPVDPILLGDQIWHHVAATWGNGIAKLFIDGSLVMESAYISGGYQLTHIYLGQMANDAGRSYVGKLDDVRIYSGVLLDFEVSDLFNKVTNVDKVTSDRNNLSFYPNPANDFLNVRFVTESGKLAEISLVNLVGQEVATRSVSALNGANDVTLSLDGVAQGIYFVQLKLDNEVTVGKVMIR